MSIKDIIEIIGSFLIELGKLVESGLSKDEALRRIRRLSDDARVIDQDVDAEAAGRQEQP